MFSKFFLTLSPAKKVAYIAVFTALAVAANTILDIDVGNNNKITFTYTICFVTAYALGAVPAFCTAVAGDAIGFWIKPSPFFWLFGLSLGIFSFLIGVILHCLPIHRKGAIYIKTAIAFVLCYIVVTLIINTFVNFSYAYLFLWGGELKKTFWVYVATSIISRLGLQSIVYAGNVALCYALLPALERLLPRLQKNRK